ncbi:DUF4145 domain-containing protein [Gluconacetobacter entanii]|uniref:DUF4145 domain-containing protein n=1 Tax=Gluconacetobacter entanii TaxID=108528 RepID=A0ABT3K7Z3_9PROT|nr:DUF4145 domain-containing protein [Gluconacetobacter entanii]MCW4591540.1 DUF4145 domain-containing protein [Gluconacetobacter entanii]MCW4595416.1 DUF4145 domain-containing protein [Gluconacetobacter entanii]NPC89845.1 DUF4145 domain-containing protein [Gluconacetobacter entanii]
MVRIALECPFCLEKRTNFEIVGMSTVAEEAPTPQAVQTGAAQCLNTHCRRFIAFLVRPLSPRAWETMINTVRGDGSISSLVEVIETCPEQPRPNIPRYLPPDVHSLLLEAEEVRLAKCFRAACVAYRTALDVATKELCASGRAKRLKLIDRIDRLEKEHKITPALREWAHTVRTIANEPAHMPTVVPREDAEEVAEITRMIMKYLFELPAAVAKAKEAAAERKKDGSKAIPALPAPDTE